MTETLAHDEGEAAPVRRGGRPSRQEAERIRERILDVATELFLADGYGATSIESVAQRVHMSKRTFYHRFRDKADLFDAVVRRIIERLRPADTSRLFDGGPLDDSLLRVARIALHASLARDAIALQRLILSEAGRFPELASIMTGEGSRREAIDGIVMLLRREFAGLALDDARFAAEHFLHMVVSLPQRRALGLGPPMSEDERQVWAEDTVRLFLHGCRGWRAAG
jgi:AcrR family transcriptional regulator